jgi:hypothetical protein
MPSDLLPRLSTGSVTDEEALRALGWRLSPHGRIGKDPEGKVFLLPKPTTDMNWLLANVPEGWASSGVEQYRHGLGWKWPLVGPDDLEAVFVEGKGPTACLALLSAILRAKGYEDAE